MIKHSKVGHFGVLELPHFLRTKNSRKIDTNFSGHFRNSVSVSAVVTSPSGRRNLKHVSRHYWFIRSLVLMTLNVLGISMNLCN